MLNTRHFSSGSSCYTEPMAIVSEKYLTELAAQFGTENVLPGDSDANGFTGWYPLAIKNRQAGLVLPFPFAVVSPASTEEVAALVTYCRAASLGLLVVGGASNTVGSTMPDRNAPTIALNLSRLDSVAWDENALSVTAGAGVVLASLEETLNRHQYTLGSLPQSAQIATVGGAVSTEAFGTFAAGYGGMRSNTIMLEAVLPDGSIVQTSAQGAATRALHHLLIGTESAFGVITSATLVIRPQPEVRAWCAFSFARFEDAADALRLVYRSDARPVCVRLFDANAAALSFATQVPVGNALLLLGVEGSEIVQTGQYQTVFAVCQQVGGVSVPIDGDAWYENTRFRTSDYATNARPDSLTDIVSVWVSWTQISAFHRVAMDTLASDTSDTSAQIGYANPHGAALDIRFVCETMSPTDALARYERLLTTLQEVARSHGANVAHHYGIGQSRRAWADAERGTGASEALERLQTALTR